MTKILTIGFGTVLLGLALAVLGLFLLAADTDRRIDFSSPLLTGRPNQYLVCPKGMCADAPNQVAPVFDVPAERLVSAWDKVVTSEPEVTVLPQADANRRSYVQHSKLFRFPDRVTMEAVSVGDGLSSLAIYSQSKYGYRDAGVNEARVKRLLSRLKDAVK